MPSARAITARRTTARVGAGLSNRPGLLAQAIQKDTATKARTPGTAPAIAPPLGSWAKNWCTQLGRSTRKAASPTKTWIGGPAQRRSGPRPLIAVILALGGAVDRGGARSAWRRPRS